MKKTALIGILGALLIFTASQVFAAETAAKIGLVNLNKAVNESEQGKKATSELTAVVKEKQEALDEKGKALEKLKSEIEKKGSAMSGEARKSKTDELERLTRDYQRALSDSQNDIRKRESEMTGHIVKELRKIIVAVANEGKYDLVIDENPALVLFAGKGIDITDIVIKKFNESNGAPAKK